jgi:hypothetical protein
MIGKWFGNWLGRWFGSSAGKTVQGNICILRPDKRLSVMQIEQQLLMTPAESRLDGLTDEIRMDFLLPEKLITMIPREVRLQLLERGKT